MALEAVEPCGRADYADRLRANLGDGPLSRSFARWMLFQDPPDHTRLRSLVGHAFSPRAVERLHQRMYQIVTGLLDKLVSRREFDLIADFAGPLPVLVICELLGVPAEDRHLFADWSIALAASLDHLTSPEVETLAGADLAAAALTAYFQDLLGTRRASPANDLPVFLRDAARPAPLPRP